MLDQQPSMTTSSAHRHNSVLNLNRAKKQADQNATLLANRILMLDSEQARLLKKIEKTRKRADQIVEVRRTNEKRQRDLAEEKKRQEDEIRRKQL